MRALVTTYIAAQMKDESCFSKTYHVNVFKCLSPREVKVAIYTWTAVAAVAVAFTCPTGAALQAASDAPLIAFSSFNFTHKRHVLACSINRITGARRHHKKLLICRVEL